MALTQSEAIREIQQLAAKLGRPPKRDEWRTECRHGGSTLTGMGSFADLRDAALRSWTPEQKREDATTEWPQPEANVDEWLDALGTLGRLTDKARPANTYRVINACAKATQPVVLAWSADWHFGSLHVDYDEFRRDLALLQSLPADRVRVALVGDLIENSGVFFSKSPQFSQIPDDIQILCLERLLDGLRNYVDFACWGNHDISRDERVRGIALVAQQIVKVCPYFPGSGWVDYVVGGETYRLRFSHKFKGTSIYHKFQGLLRQWGSEHFDIAAEGHEHTPGAWHDVPGVSPEGVPVERVIVKTGTHKTGEDTYSLRHFKRGVMATPAVVLYPDRHKMVPFVYLKDALQFAGLSDAAKAA